MVFLGCVRVQRLIFLEAIAELPDPCLCRLDKAPPSGYLFAKPSNLLSDLDRVWHCARAHVRHQNDTKP